MNGAGLFFQGVMTLMVLVVAVSVAREKGREQRRAEQAAPSAAPEAPQEDVRSAEHKETIHWTAQGLHKLGYSMAEARRVADMVPVGLGLQDAIQWCLRSQGRKQ